jgi:hypothetical protein
VENLIIGDWEPFRVVEECQDNGEVYYFDLNVLNQYLDLNELNKLVYKISFNSDGSYYEYNNIGSIIINGTWEINGNDINFVIENIGVNSIENTNELFLLTENNLGFGLRSNTNYCEDMKTYTEFSRIE